MTTELLEAEEVRQRDLERFNFAPDSKSFDCKFIEPGIISYRDQPGGGIELLRKETIDACIATAVGNSLTVGHVWVTPENRLSVEHGRVLAYEFNALDGWYHVKGVAETGQAKALIPLKRPSCGYRVTSFGPGGTYHGIRYDREITGIEFNHLAIVDRPRYEDAAFRFNAMNLFKILRKLVTRENGTDGQPTESSKTETREVSGQTVVEVDGVPVRLNDLVQTWKTQAGQVFNAHPDDEIEVDGAPVKLNELIEAHRKNRCNEEAKRKEEEEKKQRENEEAKRKEEEEKKQRENQAPKVDEGANHFGALHNARANAAAAPQTQTTSGSLADRVQAGIARYGSAPTIPGKN